MAFRNVRRILKGGVSLSAFKMLAMQASFSRPRLKKVCARILSPFVHNGEISVHYRCYGHRLTALIRVSDLQSDLFTVTETACDNCYKLDNAFAPDLIVDAGANIGMFTLVASATYPVAKKIIACEPVPRCIAQIEKHLRINQVNAEILPVCIGGRRGTIPFYIREAIASSFSSDKPYIDRMDVEVMTLNDVLQGRDAQRILIKLDIEGMELEVLESYVPSETRPVSVVGELHGRKVNGERLEEIFVTNGWTLTYLDFNETDSIFQAWSPAALQLAGDPHGVASTSQTLKLEE